MKKTKDLIIAGLCLALAIVLPIAFHSIPDAGIIFLPMHIPVLLCGLICGPVYGLACGILAPLISSFATGMPPAPVLPGMLCELAVYGLVAGLLIRFVKTKYQTANIYLSLIGAMICGRAVAGVLNALIFRAGDYSMQLWLTGSFVTAIPGIGIQIVLIPLIVLTLRKAKLIDLH